MFKGSLRFFSVVLPVIVLLGLLVLIVPRLITAAYSKGKVYSTANVPVRRVAIVFGAGLWRNGSPTPVLADRVAAAAHLYLAGKVEKLLMSGDNRYVEYNEPEAMRKLAISLGVPNDAIVLDYAGRRTYDTCYRAKAIFMVDQAILVTQAFHMPRAIYLCNRLGVDSIGVKSDLRTYPKSSLLFWNMREMFATVAAIWDVNIGHPLPVLGKQEPIFP
ncbi:MAG: ElyC/SanA/YdcF family protein [Anaerolineales bacterium]|jgi:vancomycin permeability regulator SanA